MTRQTYSSRGQTYSSIGSVYSSRAGRVWIDNFERGALDYDSLYSVDGELRSESAYTGTMGYYSPQGRTTEVWNNPTEDGEPQDSSRQAWPGPGDEFGFVTRLRAVEGQWQTWYLWGGEGRYPRYQAEFISDGTLRVQVRDPSGSRYTLASTIGAGAVDWESWVNTWLVVVIKWLHVDEGDPENGVRVMVAEAANFPFETFSWDAYDAGELDLNPFVEISSPYGGNPDGTVEVPQERGKIGFRASVGAAMDVDDIEMLPASAPSVYVPPGPGEPMPTGSTVTTPADNAVQTGVNQMAGVRIHTKKYLQGFRLTISENTANVSRAIIKQPDGLPIVTTKDISALSAGDTFDIEAPLGSGESYDILLDDGGSTEYERGRYESSSQYPYTSSDFDVTDGVYSKGGSTTQAVRYNYRSLTALK